MALLDSSSPAYKSVNVPSTAAYAAAPPTNVLSNLLRSLIGGTAPVYKTVDGRAGQTADSPGLLRIFIGSPPSYKTAAATASAELADEDGETDDVDDACGVCPPPTDTVVLL